MSFRPDPLRLLGAAWVVAGGLVAAVTGPLRLDHGSWLAAYAVLVAGVTQYVFGVVQGVLAVRRPSSRVVVAELVAWNAGAVGVIGGTLARLPLIVDVSGLLLGLGLGLIIHAVRGTGGPAWARWTYRILLVVILVSILVGLVLAQLRAG
ncbi:hypothetical protein BKD30_13035 [Tersicoccus phoenicis]|uniref:Uncharacterized protein n=2 Tax=Tersicoccus phoenicis TaxID=554083 RepID=A0A1R1L6V5_9MICC|nr:hypothetical protein BKD30_13035 [Tersicoccus phoenicis]